MSFNLKLHPQTAILFILDALRTEGGNYKLDLYINGDQQVGGVLFKLEQDLAEAKMLFAENDLVVLMGKTMEFLRAGQSEPVVAEAVLPPSVVVGVDPAAGLPDATGVPE